MTVRSDTRSIPRRGLFPDWAALAVSSLFSFRGRIGCSSYWLLVLGNIVVSGVINIPVADNLPADIRPLVILAAFILSCIALASACVRRLHDLDCSGWWALLILVPFIGLLFLVYLGLAPAKLFWPILAYLTFSFFIAVSAGINAGWAAGLSAAGASFLAVLAGGYLKGCVWYPDMGQKIALVVGSILTAAFAIWISGNFSVRFYDNFLSGAEWTLIGVAIGLVFTDKKLATEKTA